MKQCERISDLFLDLHDTQLDEELERAAREHLRQCPICREEFKWYGLTVQALTNLERVPPPPHFTAQLRAKLDTLPPSHSFLDSFRQLFTNMPYLPLPVGVTALAFVAVVAFVTYDRSATHVTLSSSTMVEKVTSSGLPRKAEAALSSSSLPSPHKDASEKSLDALGSFTVGARGVHPAKDSALSSAPPPPLARIPSSPDVFSTMAPQVNTVRVSKGGTGERQSPSTNPWIVDIESLTVESEQVDQAVESILKMLPDLRGKLLEQRIRSVPQEKILAVAIPPDAFGPLAVELINHGNVEAGPPKERDATSREIQDKHLVLTIRFVNRR